MHFDSSYGAYFDYGNHTEKVCYCILMIYTFDGFVLILLPPSFWNFFGCFLVVSVIFSGYTRVSKGNMFHSEWSSYFVGPVIVENNRCWQQQSKKRASEGSLREACIETGSSCWIRQPFPVNGQAHSSCKIALTVSRFPVFIILDLSWCGLTCSLTYRNHGY